MIPASETEPFFDETGTTDLSRFLLLTFFFETWMDPRHAAANLCAEQSTVVWINPETKEDLRGRFGAKCVSLEILASSTTPLYAVPLSAGKPLFHRCRAVIAHPWQNFGVGLPNLLSAVAGEGVFYADGITSICLEDIRFPSAYLACFQGPQFGLEGLRQEYEIHDRPFFVGVVKPNLGLSPDHFAAAAYPAWVGGLDFAKDDEMQADAPWSPTVERVRAVSSFLKKAAEKTGRRKMFIANITDENERVLELADNSVRAGASGLMVNPVFTGLSTLRTLRKKSVVPVMAHFTGEAMTGRLPGFGMSSLVWTKLMRLAGADMIGIAGFGKRMQCSDAEVLANVAACLEPWPGINTSLPIPGGSDSAVSLPDLYRRIGHENFALIAGRGVFGHPLGAEAGARSLHESWDAIRQNIPLTGYAKEKPALAAALKTFRSFSTKE